jgi:hypothetical protein
MHYISMKKIFLGILPKSYIFIAQGFHLNESKTIVEKCNFLVLYYTIDFISAISISQNDNEFLLNICLQRSL